MEAKVISKKSGDRRSEDTRSLKLDSPSIVVLQMAPERVAHYERHGDDLVLILKDGQEFIIRDFFVQYPADESLKSGSDGVVGSTPSDENGRSDLVFEDDEGVVWWGQYPAQWSEFHFTEIEWDSGAFVWWPWLLGALGAVGAGAALGHHGGGGGGDSSHPPVANSDFATTAEDKPISGNVLTNDSDPDGDTLSVTSFAVNGVHHDAGDSVSIVGVGELTLNADGSYSFTPVPNWNGIVPTVTYTITDGRGGTSSAELIITVTPVNDQPEAQSAIADQVSHDADNHVSLNVSSNFHDPDGDKLTYSASDLPSGLRIDPNTGIISGTIDHSASQGGRGGVYSVIVTATDGDGASVDLTFTWTVINPPPVANSDTSTTAEDTPVSGNVLTNDNDPDGDALSVTSFEVNGARYNAGDSVIIAGVGDLTLHADGSYTFTPVQDWNGTVPTVTYTITDGEGGTASATLDITVTPVNDPPTLLGIISDQSNADADSISSLDVSGNFHDLDGDTLIYSATGLPSGLSINPNTGLISGTIDHSASQGGPHANGIYSVIVTATDSAGASVDQIFTWAVSNPPPVANSDVATTDEDTPVSGNVLTNDNDPDGDALSVTSFEVNGARYNAGDSVIIAGVGDLTLHADGSYTFTPVQDWNGTVPTVTYTISDGEGGTASATLDITVTPVNDPPTLLGIISDQSNLDAESITGLDVSGNFIDVEGDTLRYSATGLPSGLSIDPNTGIISGTIDHSASQTGAGGVHSVTVTATDSHGASSGQTFTWTVNNPPPVANSDVATTDEDTPVSGNVLTNDRDPDGDALHVVSFEVNGAHYDAGDNAIIAGVGDLTLHADGSYTFTPAQDWNGTVPTVTYTISDGEGGTASATLTITVTPVNDAPTFDADSDISGSVIEAGNLPDGSVIVGTPSVGGQLNASDVDIGDTQSWSLTGSPNSTYGSFSVDASGHWTYTLDNSLAATQALNQGDIVELTYVVRVTDGAGSFAEQVVTITVYGTNDAPVANADFGTVIEAGVLNGGNQATPGSAIAAGNVLTNDTDVDAGETATLSVQGISFSGTSGVVGTVLAGTYGSLVLNADGTYIYTLDNSLAATQELKQGEQVTEVFGYTVTDVNGAVSSSTLSITVNGTNDRPIITSDALAASGDVTEAGSGVLGTPTASGTLTAFDVDHDATQTWSLVGGSTATTITGIYGSLSLNAATGQWTYTLDDSSPVTQALNTGDTVYEHFIVRVTDEHGAYSEQPVTITIHGSNDNLAGLGDATIVLDEDGSAIGTVQDFVRDPDDVIRVTGFTVDADGDGFPESYSPGASVVLRDIDGHDLGTFSLAADGSYNFTPAPNYAGDVPVVTYTMAEAKGSDGWGSTVTQAIRFDVTPVSDAPTLGAATTLHTDEDNPVLLGLTTPVITDVGTGTGNDDYPERLGEITLTLGGSGASGVTLVTGAMTLTPVGGKITVVLTDVDHIGSVPAEDHANGIYYLTQSQYQALQANPLSESGKNFTITVSATSYEVESDGTVRTGVSGATSTQVLSIDVQAVTDGATLASSTSSLTFAEDTRLDLSSYLSATLNNTDGNLGTDTDGSETYWYTVGGLPVGSIVTIDGVVSTISASAPTASSAVSTSATPPAITIQPPTNYSGDITGVTVTLHAKDTDSDSSGAIAIVDSAVTFDLHVTPVAGDVSVQNVSTLEDTAVAFLSGVKDTDTGTAHGSEVIDSVAFSLPTGWVLTPPVASSGWSYVISGSDVTISFDASLSEAQREAILSAFMIKPPAHSSADATITLSITSTDSNTVNSALVSDTRTIERNLKITVTAVAERTDTDSDGDGAFDVTLTPGHAYISSHGYEDAWFALGTDGSFKLADGWSDSDGDETLYAVLTPTLQSTDPGDTVIGTQFRYSTDGGTSWVTQAYIGDPIWVPAAYLGSLEVKLPADVSGTLTIGVQAGTSDTDPDTGVTVTDTSGSATLSLIEFWPVADAVTMALNARAAGMEDTPIPLGIKTTSSDASETFNVTLSGVPSGATITYNGVVLTVINGSVTIDNFSNSAPLSITPPPNSNDDFTLTVSAYSVDSAPGIGVTDTSAVATRTILVSVTGVADIPVVTAAGSYSVTEAVLDSNGGKVALSSLLASVTSADTDGSESITVRITGLAEGFSISGATSVVSGVGTERVWIVSANDLSNVYVVVPENHSGTVKLQVAGVSTENDGDSLTGPLTEVSFTITPSPESTVTNSVTLTEDVISPLGLSIIHHNGDTNETLGKVYIAVGYETQTYTLYLSGVELSAAGLATTTIDGVDYYVVPADQVAELGAKGASNLDGNLGALDLLYEVTDPSSDGTLPAVTVIEKGALTLTATPVTDVPTASITDITMTSATGSVADVIANDKAAPDTATVTHSGTVTVNLHVDSADTDGSEHLIRVLIDGVPDGVTVIGAAQTGAGSWLLVYAGANAKSIGTGGINVPVEFVVGRGASNGTSSITMTVQTQDEGQSTTSPASIEADSVGWNLVLSLDDGQAFAPPVIDQWSYNGVPGTEDTAFTLGNVIDAVVHTGDNTLAYTYTVTVTDVPAGSTVTGMILTTINGQAVYTATVLVPVNGDSQAALEGLLDGITITPPANGNDNNANFDFDATLTAAAVGGTSTKADTNADMPIIPVTDDATITVTTSNVDEGTNSVVATIDARDTVDGSYGQIVDGKLYVQISTTHNDGGTLTDSNGNTLSLVQVAGVSGLPDGAYYVLDVGVSGGTVELTYTTADGTVLQPGDVTFTAWARSQEVGAANEALGTSTASAQIVIVNNGVTVQSQAVTGKEAASSDKSNAIELTGLGVTLNDNDGSESIHSILLAGVPVGFLIYVGTDAGNATLAQQSSNAGGDGITNTWVLSTDGVLPAYVAILPARHWSGELSDLSLVVESGENSLSTVRVDSVVLGAVTVVAVPDGLSIEPTVSFGTEGQLIEMNLNASMLDPVASMVQGDDSSETTTLQITGMGEHAAFYVGDNLLTSSVSYDDTNDTYTLTGLTQADLDALGFVQAAAAVSDQDAGTSGTQVSVTAWTVESANGNVSSSASGSLTLSLAAVPATTGDDHFIWNGMAINGRAGNDTVALRYGEDVSHDQLASLLKNVEVIDLSVQGANGITGGLSIADVIAVTGSSSGTLTIKGDSQDHVELSSQAQWQTDGAVSNGYVTYTSGSGATLQIDENIYNNHHVTYA